ncbi:MAG: hydroxyacid dehydrogenase [Anaerolineaceae bacterium]|nr:hydroxyacid dehydrogenase [Anaerolineaceae bacterium]MDE0329658.1 hydroxyacid dehydrogenase [Anaerolineaceae bacterium]
MHRIWFEWAYGPEYDGLIGEDVERLAADQGSADGFQNIESAQAVIAGGLPYDEVMMRRAPELLVIARTGIGFDKVDLEQATRHGIAVVNTPDGPTMSTAELALSLLMGVAKNLPTIREDMRRNLIDEVPRPTYRAIELAGRQLGLVGLGRIGSHVARVALAMGMEVQAHDPFLSSEHMQGLGVTPVDSLETLLATSDVVSLHLPLNEDTRHVMNAERFSQMKDDAIFINVSRGGHVDEPALMVALDSGRLFGVGLDVCDPEPPMPDNPLLTHERVILTPHIAGSTPRANYKMLDMAMAQVRQVFAGERPPFLLNPDVWPKVAKRLEASQP